MLLTSAALAAITDGKSSQIPVTSRHERQLSKILKYCTKQIKIYHHLERHVTHDRGSRSDRDKLHRSSVFAVPSYWPRRSLTSQLFQYEPMDHRISLSRR